MRTAHPPGQHHGRDVVAGVICPGRQRYRADWRSTRTAPAAAAPRDAADIAVRPPAREASAGSSAAARSLPFTLHARSPDDSMFRRGEQGRSSRLHLAAPGRRSGDRIGLGLPVVAYLLPGTAAGAARRAGRRAAAASAIAAVAPAGSNRSSMTLSSRRINLRAAGPWRWAISRCRTVTKGKRHRNSGARRGIKLTPLIFGPGTLPVPAASERPAARSVLTCAATVGCGTRAAAAAVPRSTGAGSVPGRARETLASLGQPVPLTASSAPARHAGPRRARYWLVAAVVVGIAELANLGYWRAQPWPRATRPGQRAPRPACLVSPVSGVSRSRRLRRYRPWSSPRRGPRRPGYRILGAALAVGSFGLRGPDCAIWQPAAAAHPYGTSCMPVERVAASRAEPREQPGAQSSSPGRGLGIESSATTVAVLTRSCLSRPPHAPWSLTRRPTARARQPAPQTECSVWAARPRPAFCPGHGCAQSGHVLRAPAVADARGEA